VANLPGSVTFVIAASTANITLVTGTVKSTSGLALAFPTSFDLYLSDAVTGAGLTAVTASGAVTVGTPGAVIGTYTTKKALRVQTDAVGAFQLSITDTAKTGFYVVYALDGLPPFVSRQLVTGDYG